MSALKVYWFSGSPYSWKVLLALEEKKIPYESCLIAADKGDHKKPEFLAMNPRGKVPVMQCGSDTVYESVAIFMYLEKKFPNNTLLPADLYPKIMTKTLEVEYFAGSIPIRALLTFDPKVTTNDQLKEIMKPVVKELEIWEGYYAAGNPFLFGKDLTLADIAFFPHLAFLVRQGLDLQRYPKLKAFYDVMAARDTTKKTWPPHYLTTPGKTYLSVI